MRTQVQERAYYLKNREAILARHRSRYAENPEKKNLMGKRWRAANSEAVRVTRRAAYLKNTPKVSRQVADWRKKNPLRYRTTTRKWRLANRDRLNALERKRRQDFPEKVRKTRREGVFSRRRSDPLFRLLGALRCRVWGTLKGAKKSARTQELVGCSILELRAHLEKQFQEGMTWENYGPVWHCDHIRPCARFNLADPAQQRECFRFTNLQPLFAMVNLRKGAR